MTFNQKTTEYLFLSLILVSGLFVRYVAILFFNHSPESDELAYQSMALNMVNGNGIIDSMGNHAMYNVGYPLFILAPIFSFLGENLLAARLANIALGGLSIALCHLVAREAGAGRLGRLLAAAIWAFWLPASVYGVYLFKENLMTPLMLGVVWCGLRLTKSYSPQTAILCGVLLGLLALTGNAALALTGMIIVALILTPASLKERAILGVLILTTAVAVATPWLIRNTLVLGAPVLNTNGGFNLYLGNNPAATGWFVSIGDTPRGATWRDLHQKGELEAAETLKAEAIDWIKMHPDEFVTLAVKKAIYFWTPPFHKGKGPGSTTETLVRILWAAQFIFLIIAAVGTLMVRQLRNRQTAMLWFSVLCYTAVHMLFYVIFRYREPIMPLLGILAALTIEHILSSPRLSTFVHRSSFHSKPKNLRT